MTTEDYVSYETSKLLKEKGFSSDDCHTAYDEDKVFFWYGDYSKDRKGIVDAPTQALAMKWLREEYNKIIVPGISLDDRTSSTINYYIVGIWYVPKNNGGAFCYTSPTPYGGYPSFEEACESAIKYCLEKLI